MIQNYFIRHRKKVIALLAFVTCNLKLFAVALSMLQKDDLSFLNIITPFFLIALNTWVSILCFAILVYIASHLYFYLVGFKENSSQSLNKDNTLIERPSKIPFSLVLILLSFISLLLFFGANMSFTELFYNFLD